ncbi:[similarity to] malic enzyme, NAD binding domain protein [methanotrophic bacterial endosymbiont of Bathymodiolus sp.]|nr:[similarity to] malic enzyme, NAD binding domain protein [methanotrophic bacterial endosymbiont of Bathymodiolus sp.]
MQITKTDKHDGKNKKRPLYTPYASSVLLETALLNKGSAFTASERQEFNLDGLLPTAIESIEDQGNRAYHQFSHLRNDLNKHIFLRTIQDANETSLLQSAQQAS